MKHAFFFALTLMATSLLAQATYPTIGEVVRLDPRLDQLLPKGATIEVLASGFAWSEGPVWVRQSTTGTLSTDPQSGYLLFSDVPKNTIYRWTAKDGCQPFLSPSGYTGLGTYSDEPGSNGLTVDAQGRLIACEHGDRRVSAMPLSGVGGKITLADRYQGKRFNSPNDVVTHPNGSYYFTDPPYGLAKKENDPTRETLLFGVYRVAAGGEVSLIIKDLVRPNGLAFSPDYKMLYVAQSDGNQPVVNAYPVQVDGSVGAGRLVLGPEEMKRKGLSGGFDGMKVDRNGNLWVTGARGVLVLSAAGELLGHIKVGEATANCAWGDDGSTLYITADMYLCRIRTLVKGAGWEK